MKPEQFLVADLVALLLLFALAGLGLRQRVRLCWSFAWYLAFALLTNRLVVWWPERFWTSSFWIMKESVQSVLNAVVALELATLIFARLPRARHKALGFMFVIAAFTLGWMTTASPGPASLAWAWALQARAQAGGAWMFLALVAVMIWHRIPIRGFHRSIILGFVLHMAVYGGVLGFAGSIGAAAYPYLAALDPASFAASAGIWMFGAWKAQEPNALSEEAMGLLRPWAR